TCALPIWIRHEDGDARRVPAAAPLAAQRYRVRGVAQVEVRDRAARIHGLSGRELVREVDALTGIGDRACRRATRWRVVLLHVEAAGDERPRSREREHA